MAKAFAEAFEANQANHGTVIAVLVAPVIITLLVVDTAIEALS